MNVVDGRDDDESEPGGLRLRVPYRDALPDSSGSSDSIRSQCEGACGRASGRIPVE